MEKQIFSFKSYLIEKYKNNRYTSPLAILNLDAKECALKCDEIRSKLYSLFKEVSQHKELEYKIYLEDGTLWI